MLDDRLRARALAEMLGTAWLVFGGCGARIVHTHAIGPGLGTLGAALAFGVSITTAIAAFGHVSGGHFNPAVTVGMAASGRFAWRETPAYVGAQVAGATLGATLLYVIASGLPAFSAGTFATNGYGHLSPSHAPLWSAFIAELLLTYMFVTINLGASDSRSKIAAAPVVIGLALTLVHLVGIPLTNASVNPARSTGPALFAGTDALAQLWLFWLAPAAGGLAAGATYPALAR